METRYRTENGVHLIELKLGELRQLFNSLDPAPFIEKDLDKEAENYIVDSVREFHISAPLRLVIHLPPAHAADADGVPDAIHNYFAYRAETARKELRYTLRQGRSTLLIGLSFLFLCVAARQLIAQLGHGTLAWILEEGLLIMGWVAMWRPLQIFLYDWWPIRRKQQVYRKIQDMPVDVRTGGLLSE